MSRRPTSPKLLRPTVTIRVSGTLFHGHLAYLDQLVQSADECQLGPVLNLASLEEIDRAALLYLVEGENRSFTITDCPNFIREWMEHERSHVSAA